MEIKNYLQICCFCFLASFENVRCRLPVTPKTTKKTFEMPFELKPHELNYLKVPSEEFCRHMEFKTGRLYLVLPWWYDYCSRLKEKSEKRYMARHYNLPAYANVLRRVQNYKSLMRAREQMNFYKSPMAL